MYLSQVVSSVVNDTFLQFIFLKIYHMNSVSKIIEYAIILAIINNAVQIFSSVSTKSSSTVVCYL